VSIVEQIPHLEKLVTVDHEIRALTERMEKAQGEIGGAKAELQELDLRLTRDRTAVAEMDHTRQELTRELRNMEKQIERSRERLSRARNERESNAAERELEELRKLHRDRDEEIKKLGELIDQARTSIEEGEKRQAEIAAQLEGSMEGVTRTVTELEGRLAELRTERQAALALLPKQLARRYESLRSRRAVAVAKTQDGICMGCHIGLPPMMYHEMLSQSRFEECPHCHRIIYYAPPPPEPEAATEHSSGETAA
jgi:predicted  nucleic acid-binding Zn-ribbon protein